MAELTHLPGYTSRAQHSAWVAARLWQDLHHLAPMPEQKEAVRLAVAEPQQPPLLLLSKACQANNQSCNWGERLVRALAHAHQLACLANPGLYFGSTGLAANCWCAWQLAPLGNPCAKGELLIACSEPYSLGLCAALIARQSGKTPKLQLVAPEQLAELLATLRSLGQHQQLEATALDISHTAPPPDLHARQDEYSIVGLCNWMFGEAMRLQASDLHLEAKTQALHVRARCDGLLTNLFALSRQSGQLLLSRIKLLAGIDITEQRRPQDGRISLLHNNRNQEIRVASIPTVHGEKLVLRFFDPGLLTRSLSSLGMHNRQLQAWRKLLARQSGLLLSVGPTGSGKTTTLYASLHSLADSARNICTVEDPVEILALGFTQVQVNQAIDFGFGVALKHMLRQDPDIIMIGEIRDAETAATAVQAALTGHLVLASLHTTDSLSAVYRLRELGIAPYLLRATLAGVMAQRLVRLVCRACKGQTLTSYCATCQGRGYMGRQAIFELLPGDEMLIDSIATRPLAELRQSLASQGFRQLWYYGQQLVADGLTSSEEIERVCPLPATAPE